MTAVPGLDAWEPTRARLRVNGIDIAYSLCGHGPVVVLVHGFACGQRMWLHQVRALRRDYTVLTYDQRGHGATSAPAEAEAYSAGHLARDLVGLLDALSIERCHLVGFSLGGGPALSLALTQPQRVASLVLADVGAGAESPFLMSSVARRWTSVGRSLGMKALADEILRGEFFKAYAARSRRSQCHMRGLIEGTPLDGLLFTLSEVLAKRKSLFRTAGALKGVRAPTLVMRGEQDNVCRAASKLLAQSIAGAESIVIPGAGHMAPLEEPGAFNAALTTFFARASG